MSITFAGDPDEHARRLSNRDRALEALRAAGDAGILNTALMAIAGSRAGGRVDELRDLGYVIDCERVRAGLFRRAPPPAPRNGPTATELAARAIALLACAEKQAKVAPLQHARRLA